MKRIKQEHYSGCGLACVAMIVGKKYSTIRKTAHDLLNMADDHDLYTNSTHLIQLLSHFEIETSQKKIPFTSWEKLPEKAIVAINHNKESDIWHWVVFQKNQHGTWVLDPKPTIKSDRRTDFNRMKPKWYIAVHS